MRISYQLDGTPVPRFEPGDMVRLVRDEPGPLVTAHAGDWGEVMRNHGSGGLDIRLAGYSRPRNAAMPIATGVPASYVWPCDRSGVRLRLQRDLARRSELI
jgi:hypothetical protein